MCGNRVRGDVLRGRTAAKLVASRRAAAGIVPRVLLPLYYTYLDIDGR